MKASSKVIVSVILLLAGFGLGYLCANVSTTGSNGKGDITKVSKYSKNVVSPQASAFQEKIMNDPAELQRAKASLTLLGSRMTEFDNLVDMSVISCEGIAELAPSVSKLTSIRSLSDNAKKTALDAIDAFNSMVAGTKNSASDYESASQKLSLAYMMVDRQITVGKEFVTDVDSYLKGKNVEDNMELALSRDLWAGYCAGEAVLNGDKDEFAYWTKKEALVTTDALGMFVNNPEAALRDLDAETVLNSMDALGQIVEFGINAEVVANNGRSEEVMQNNLDMPIMGYYLKLKDNVRNNVAEEVMNATNAAEEVMNATSVADEVMNATDQIRVIGNSEGFAKVLNLQESVNFLCNDIKVNTVNAVGAEQDVIGYGTKFNFVDFALSCTSVTDVLSSVGGIINH
jgi:hypothetical protein